METITEKKGGKNSKMKFKKNFKKNKKTASSPGRDLRPVLVTRESLRFIIKSSYNSVSFILFSVL